MNRRTLILTLSAAALAAGTAVAAGSPPQAGRPAMTTRPSGDAAIIHTVADAMGFIRGLPANEQNNTINRLQLRGSGTMVEGGVNYRVTSYIYTMSLFLKAAREDIKRTAPGGETRAVHVVLDQDAWDEKEPGVDGAPTTESAKTRRLQMARTPFGFTRALLDAPAGSVRVTDPGARGKVTVVLPIEGVQTTATLDADYRPETIAMTVDGHAIVSRYGAYADLHEYGVMFPTRWSETVDGKKHLDLRIEAGRVASYAVFPKPAFLSAGR